MIATSKRIFARKADTITLTDRFSIDEQPNALNSRYDLDEQRSAMAIFIDKTSWVAQSQ
jgi:hypothetical protein